MVVLLRLPWLFPLRHCRPPQRVQAVATARSRSWHWDVEEWAVQRICQRWVSGSLVIGRIWRDTQGDISRAMKWKPSCQPCPFPPVRGKINHGILRYPLPYHSHPKKGSRQALIMPYVALYFALFWDEGGIEGGIFKAYE